MKKVLLTALFAFSAVCLTAQIKLPRLISNGMILQRDLPLKIWGWSAAHENVTISFLNKEYSAQADKNGNWTVVLPKQKAGGPYTMQLEASNIISLSDILIGDVWVCGGQSNMELWMDRMKYKYATEMANANNTAIRQFLVPDKYNFQAAQADVEAGTWLPVTPQNIGEFSGVAYFFAKEINEKHKIPIGLINTALGGSPAEAWISEEALKKFPAYYNEVQKFKDNGLIKIGRAHV
jgi:sialate O-acetylesterase